MQERSSCLSPSLLQVEQSDVLPAYPLDGADSSSPSPLPPPPPPPLPIEALEHHYYCDICTACLDGGDLVQFECGHKYHEGCIQCDITLQITGCSFPVMCPVTGCEQEPSMMMLSMLTSRQNFQACIGFEQSLCQEINENACCCCGQRFLSDVEVSSHQCLKCKTINCLKCHCSFHPNNPCKIKITVKLKSQIDTQNIFTEIEEAKLPPSTKNQSERLLPSEVKLSHNRVLPELSSVSSVSAVRSPITNQAAEGGQPSSRMLVTREIKKLSLGDNPQLIFQKAEGATEKVSEGYAPDIDEWKFRQYKFIRRVVSPKDTPPPPISTRNTVTGSSPSSSISSSNHSRRDSPMTSFPVILKNSERSSLSQREKSSDRIQFVRPFHLKDSSSQVLKSKNNLPLPSSDLTKKFHQSIASTTLQASKNLPFSQQHLGLSTKRPSLNLGGSLSYQQQLSSQQENFYEPDIPSTSRRNNYHYSLLPSLGGGGPSPGRLPKRSPRNSPLLLAQLSRE